MQHDPMTRVAGAVLGMFAGPLAVALGGAVLGFVQGGYSCCRSSTPYTLDGALTDAFLFTLLLGLPAAILGAAFGALFARGFRGVNLGLLMIVIAAVAVALSLTL